MNTKNFVKILKKVVKEEMRSVIKEELTEILREGLKPTISEVTTNEPTTRHKIPTAPKPARKKLADSVKIEGPLGDILRETANSLQNGSADPIKEDQTGAYPDMAPTFQANDAEGFGVARDSAHTQVETMSGDPTNQFVKDYSKVLQKSIDIHSGNK